MVWTRIWYRDWNSNDSGYISNIHNEVSTIKNSIHKRNLSLNKPRLLSREKISLQHKVDGIAQNTEFSIERIGDQSLILPEVDERISKASKLLIDDRNLTYDLRMDEVVNRSLFSQKLSHNINIDLK